MQSYEQVIDILQSTTTVLLDEGHCTITERPARAGVLTGMVTLNYDNATLDVQRSPDTTAFLPSESACFPSSPGSSSRTAVSTCARDINRQPTVCLKRTFLGLLTANPVEVATGCMTPVATKTGHPPASTNNHNSARALVLVQYQVNLTTIALVLLARDSNANLAAGHGLFVGLAAETSRLQRDAVEHVGSECVRDVHCILGDGLARMNLLEHLQDVALQHHARISTPH